MRNLQISDASCELLAVVAVAWLAGCARGSGQVSTGVAAPATRALSHNLRCPSGSVLVRRGTLTIGSDNEVLRASPQHLVSVADFCIQKSEVTYGDYQACVAARACLAGFSDVDDDHPVQKERSALCASRHPEHTNAPMNCVDWRMADQYCSWTGGRLPTEQQWEYAARGTDGRDFPWGKALPDEHRVNGCLGACAESVRRLAMMRDSVVPGLNPVVAGAPYTLASSVGELSEGASPFGILNMADGVSEWTLSPWCRYDGEDCMVNYAVLRGGCWASSRTNEFNSAKRAGVPIAFHGHCTGIRCVFSPEGS